MAKQDTPLCAYCGIEKCRHPEREGNFPYNCQRETHKDVLESTVREGWTDPELRKINAACEEVLRLGDSPNGPRWCRVQEVIAYARIMGYRKLGLAFCTGLMDEAKTLHKILEENGFVVISVNCMTGTVDRRELGVKGKSEFPWVCNPLMQAEVLNREKTELNIMVGLCLGHDILFIKRSKADVTPLVVKDRVLCHNPVGALYLHKQYFRKRLDMRGEKLG
ncbi:MAG TPA: DUF1847 domain-containing protein [Candidatus Bathyarchaeia archaeon]|nr:DUF1847 domain-containing protein [Candidatus Bathyarchaeia archaeon]